MNVTILKLKHLNELIHKRLLKQVAFLLKVLVVSTMTCNQDRGSEFHAVGPATENAHSPNFVEVCETV